VIHDITTLVTENRLISAVLSQPRKGSGAADKTTVRPFTKQNARLFQFIFQIGCKVKHENLTASEAADRLYGLLSAHYHQGLLITADEEIHITHFTKWKIKRAPKKQNYTAPAAHDNAKKYIIPEGVPAAFLEKLGIMNASGYVYKDKQAKFRQINQFLALLTDGLASLPQDRPLRIIDLGCGKSTLTFALHHYITVILGRQVNLTGIDVKADVMEQCQQIADLLECEGLSFRRDEIKRVLCDKPPDMVISLHACDTATDDAICQAVLWGARYVYCAPCCQHEVNKTIARSDMKPLLRHGTLKERTASLLTDALRAEFLTSCGYKATVCEFIETEHTPKNLMIKAMLSRKPDRDLFNQTADFAHSWGAHMVLEKELRRVMDW
jgi:SAM-dependent methyltransferase